MPGVCVKQRVGFTHVLIIQVRVRGLLDDVDVQSAPCDCSWLTAQLQVFYWRGKMSRKFNIVPRFSVRADADEGFGKTISAVESALGIHLAKEFHRGCLVMSSEVLGMRIELSPWHGLDGKPTYQLHGEVEDDPLLDQLYDLEDFSIDQIIIDLLLRKNAGPWRKPNPGERVAEGEFASSFDDSNPLEIERVLAWAWDDL